LVRNSARSGAPVARAMAWISAALGGVLQVVDDGGFDAAFAQQLQRLA
jgi:hypothetical protein